MAGAPTPEVASYFTRYASHLPVEVAAFGLGALLLGVFAFALLESAGGRAAAVLLVALLLVEDAVFAGLMRGPSTALSDLQNYLFMLAGGPAAWLALAAGLEERRWRPAAT